MKDKEIKKNIVQGNFDEDKVVYAQSLEELGIDEIPSSFQELYDKVKKSKVRYRFPLDSCNYAVFSKNSIRDYQTLYKFVWFYTVFVSYKPQKQKHHKQLAKLQRRLTRKTKGSANYEKARIKVARLEKHIADSRKWWIENESLRLTKNYSTIGIEDLNLQGIAKFLRNAKNVTDCGYGIFVNRLIQKGEELGTSVIKVDRYFPSSQLCHCCGYQNHNLKLSDREWTCPNCGEHHIRDYNASINLKNEALSIRMRRAEFRSVEDVEDIQSLVLQALDIGASDEAESTTCESVRKAYSL